MSCGCGVSLSTVNPAASQGDSGGGSLVLPAQGYQGKPEEFSSVVSGPTDQDGCKQCSTYLEFGRECQLEPCNLAGK